MPKTEAIGTSSIQTRYSQGIAVERSLAEERVIAVGSLTQRDIDVLGKLSRINPFF
jgi:hypothetical protein